MNSLWSEAQGANGQLHIEQAFFLAGVLEQLPVAVISTDRDFRILSWNRAAQELYGWQAVEVLGRSYEAVVQGDYQLLSVDAVSQAAQTLGAWSGQAWHVQQGDLRVPVTVSIRALKDVQQQVTGFVITSREVPEEDVQSPSFSEKQYRVFFEEAPVMNVITELRGGDLYVKQCNPTFLATLGYEQAEVLGRPMGDFYTTVSRGRLAERLRLIMQGKTVTEERELLMSDGRVLVTLMKAVVVCGPDGQVLGTLSTFIDISERKAMEDQLRTSEEKLQALFASLDDIVFEVDEAGTLLDLWVSDEELLFLPREQVLGRTLLDIFGEQTSRPFYGMLQQVFASGASATIEYALELPAGTHWFSARCNLVKNKVIGRPLVSILVRDITERKRIETRQELSDEILNSLTDFVLVANGQGEIVYVTPAIEAMLGYHSEEILGDGWWQVERGTPEDLAAERQYVQKAARGEVSVDRNTYEHLFRVKSGAYRWFTMRDIKGPRDLLIGVGHDITERKMAEQLVKEANDKFVELANNIPDIFWSEDPITGKTLFVSPAFEKITGRMLEELATFPDEYLSLVLPEDRGVIHDARRLEASGQKTEIEYRIRHKDGGIRWIRDKGIPVFDANGRVVRVVGVGSDVTEQILAEKLLRESETRFRQLAENIKEAFWVFDASVDRTVYVSPAYETIWGRTCESMYQDETDYIQAILPEDRQTMNAAVLDQLAGLSTDIEYRIHRPDGALRWIWDRSFPVFDEAGVLAKTIGVATDVTDLKSIQHELEMLNQELEQRVRIRTAELAATSHRLSLATGAAKLGVWELNILTSRLIWDEQVYAIYGRTPDAFEVTFENFASIVHPEDLPVLLSFLEMALQGDLPTKAEYRVIHGDGSLRYIQAHGVMVKDDTGQVVQLIGVVQDVTQEKQAELTLRQNEETLRSANLELERANRAKDEFLATMSHELRTPLTSILGLTESLLMQTYGAITQKQDKVLHSVNHSGQHLLGLINDVLDLTKINAGQCEIYPETLDLDTVCNESLAFVRPQAQAKGIKVIYSPAMHAEKALADPRRLKQILCNLLGNAVKFTPEQGRVSLTVKADHQKNKLAFIVTDSGIGIAAEDQARVFTPFFQVDSRLNRSFEGTGLGLAMVLRLTELHGGTVALESAEGVGSTFTVTLPWSPESAQNPKKDSKTSSNVRHDLTPKKRGSILLVEDTEASVMTIVDYLEYQGYTMLTASTGPEGLSKAMNHNPDLILMDIQMPGMDGMEAIRQLRADSRFKTTPVIAITALAMTGDRERILAAGADEYISKPVSLKQLAVLVEALLKR